MINNFYNGLGAVFAINLLAWFEFLCIALVVFGSVFMFVSLFRMIFVSVI